MIEQLPELRGFSLEAQHLVWGRECLDSRQGAALSFRQGRNLKRLKTALCLREDIKKSTSYLLDDYLPERRC